MLTKIRGLLESNRVLKYVAIPQVEGVSGNAVGTQIFRLLHSTRFPFACAYHPSESTLTWKGTCRLQCLNRIAQVNGTHFGNVLSRNAELRQRKLSAMNLNTATGAFKALGSSHYLRLGPCSHATRSPGSDACTSRKCLLRKW